MMEEFLARQTLLVVAPHADDEVIQSGGLMQRVKAAGGQVFVLVLSVGNLDHYTTTDEKHTEGNTRKSELGAAMELLEVDDWEIALEDEHLHLRLDSLPRRDLVTIIERSARLSTDNIEPTMLAIPAPSFNQDHVAAYHACVTACRPHLASMKSFQRVVLVADAPQLRWQPETPFTPDFYVTLTEHEVEKKVQAYCRHQSQVRPAPHMGSADALRDLAKARGMEISVPFAEAYETLRFVC